MACVSGSNIDCSRGVCSLVFPLQTGWHIRYSRSVGLLALSVGLVAVSVGLVTESDGFAAESCTWLVSEGS